jgi:REP element-mobilizing transposase RayT
MKTPEKYRKAIRLKGYNYSQEGFYFVTIVVKDRKSLFGEIKDERINLSNVGIIAKKFWEEIPKHFTNVALDEYVVMPNHIHGIIIIANNNKNAQCRGVQLNAPTKGYFSHISPRGNTLSVIIRTYKGAVTRWCKNNNIRYFKWQRNYYEHIVRNEKELNKIREYLHNNSLQWELDRENPESKDFNSDHDLYWKHIYEK